ncbi:MAG: hypothetical protein IPK81_07780 [Rhodospirillales bacterium]|nr:MAG: hypothetical protein IPK81_07780 [Rhodospirillales bacterium]
MPISDLTDDQLENLHNNYRRMDRTGGGKYSLAEVLLERRRRLPSPFDTREVAQRIIELSKKSEDNLLTYGQLWASFRPNTPWQGRHSQQVMSNTLERVISYCIRNELPILTVLVVQSAARQLSPEAVARICRECTELGVDTGVDALSFINDQIDRSKRLVVENLPTEA